MKILRTVGILALVGGLVLGGTGSAFANGPHSPSKRGLVGTVDSTAGYVVTLATKEGSTVDVTLTDTAKYMVPGETKGMVDLDSFETKLDGSIDADITAIEGRRIAVLVTDFAEYTNTPSPDSPDFTATAIRLMLLPSPESPPSWVHRVGVVNAFTQYDPGPPAIDGEIIIVDKDDVEHTFTINEDTVYRPATIAGMTEAELQNEIDGGCVTVVTKGDPKLTPPLVAKVIVLHNGLPAWAQP